MKDKLKWKLIQETGYSATGLVLDKIEEECLKATVLLLTNLFCFDGITVRTLRKWEQWSRTYLSRKKPGIKMDLAFDADVWSRLILVILDAEKGTSTVLVNVTYSYEIIKKACLEAQRSPEWINNDQIKKLKFSAGWIHNFLSRMDFNRRKITAEEKIRPTVTEINRIMKEGQQTYEEKKIDYSRTYNMDETAITWAIGPTHVFCHKSARRGIAPTGANTKVRITACICVNAKNQFAPLFMIIKNYVAKNKADQTSTTVLQNLQANNAYFSEAQGGWKLEQWTQKLPIRKKDGVLVDIEYKSLYLIHGFTGHVITSQPRAWNDQVRLCMWLQLIVKPLIDRDGDILLWWNNCTVHETFAVQNAIKAMKGLHTAPLPKNCTDILQVLDLVVNGPIKHHYRTTRAERLYDYFKEFKSKVATNWSTMSRDDQNNIQFKPPVQTLPKALEDLINLFAKWNDDDHPEHKLKGVQSSFIATGCVPNLNEDNIEPGVDEVKKFENFDAASTDQRSKTLPIILKDVLTLSTASVSDEVDIDDNFDFLDALAALAEPDSD
ncbi:MAG: hypothetical protein JHC73_20910, partial [Dolichospermum sp.]|nr:hypothetical protein [Dolichospermum sp.]